jgi:phosphoenolpyruvate---glycerone phosphotransferase subunit DhaL
MTETIGTDELKRMLRSAAAQIKEQNLALSALDSAIGDGDHGATMVRICDHLVAVSADQNADIQGIFRDAGWRILGADGGASSSILGMFFLGMGDVPAPGPSLDCQGLATTFEAGLAAVSKHTAAKPGDKTLMDALTPAITSFRSAANAGKSVDQALRQAASSARAGAKSTTDLVARFGRAKFLGERTRGHQDPGANSVALLFEGFSTALPEMKGDANA